jgi:hypothetical protein
VQDSLEIASANEEAYLNELVAHWLHFEGYKYDRITSKLVEVPINVLQKNSHVQATTIITSFWKKCVVTINENLSPLEEEQSWPLFLALYLSP